MDKKGSKRGLFEENGRFFFIKMIGFCPRIEGRGRCARNLGGGRGGNGSLGVREVKNAGKSGEEKDSAQKGIVTDRIESRHQGMKNVGLSRRKPGGRVFWDLTRRQRDRESVPLPQRKMR